MMNVDAGKSWGDEWRPGRAFTHIHHLLFDRSNAVLSRFLDKCNQLLGRHRLLAKLTLTAVLPNSSRMYRWRENGKGGTISGTFYLSSTPQENNVCNQIGSKISHFSKVLCVVERNSSVVGVQSLTSKSQGDSSVDYIFLDPPFGSNLAYSELNFLAESWCRVWTNNTAEAIENKTQLKGPAEYRRLMADCFGEAYRVLKPGHWMTVEFSNTKASVWNGIQAAIAEAGFIVANVSALDKKQGSFNAVTTPTAVKQDLIVSAYKPDGGFEKRFQREAQAEEGVWDFVRTHLNYLPVTKRQGRLLHFVPERDPRKLFDQMVAYYVRKGYPVPISSPEFQVGMGQRFVERDGMYFMSDQAAEYDRSKMASDELKQSSMFVFDEASSIQWLRQIINEKPQTFSDINPKYMQQLGGWNKSEALLDLRELLTQNFLCYDGIGPVPEQIHAYLSSNWKDMRNLPKDNSTLVAKALDRWYVPDPNKAGDLEKLREKALLKEFEEYKEAKKKLKLFRLESVRAGFKRAWQERDYATILAVSEKIPTNVLEEDPKLLMWYDQALTRTGDGG